MKHFTLILFLLVNTLSYSQQNLGFSSGIDLVNTTLTSKNFTSDGSGNTSFQEVSENQLFSRIRLGGYLEYISSERFSFYQEIDFNVGIGVQNTYEASEWSPPNQVIPYDVKESYSDLYLRTGVNLSLLGDLEDSDQAIGITGGITYSIGYINTTSVTKRSFPSHELGAEWHNGDGNGLGREYLANFLFSFGLFGQKTITDDIYLYGGIDYHLPLFKDAFDNNQNINIKNKITFQTGIKYIIF